MSRPEARRRKYLIRLHRVQRARCAICGGKMPSPNKWAALPADERPNADHVFPLSGGGMDTLSNLLAVHPRCNVEKGNRQPTQAEAEMLRWVRAALKAPFPQWSTIKAARSRERRAQMQQELAA